MPRNSVATTLDFIETYDVDHRNLYEICTEKLTSDERPSVLFRRKVIEMEENLPPSRDLDTACTLAWAIVSKKLPDALAIHSG